MLAHLKKTGRCKKGEEARHEIRIKNILIKDQEEGKAKRAVRWRSKRQDFDLHHRAWHLMCGINTLLDMI